MKDVTTDGTLKVTSLCCCGGKTSTSLTNQMFYFDMVDTRYCNLCVCVCVCVCARVYVYVCVCFSRCLVTVRTQRFELLNLRKKFRL